MNIRDLMKTSVPVAFAFAVDAAQFTHITNSNIGHKHFDHAVQVCVIGQQQQ